MEHLAQAVARALAPGGEHDLPPGLLQLPDVPDQRVEDVHVAGGALGGKGAPGAPAEIERRRVLLQLHEGGETCVPPGRERRQPLVGREIEATRRDGLVGHGARRGALPHRVAPRLVMVADLRQPVGERLLGEMADDDGDVRQVIEQRLELLVEERQPVLHAGEAPAFAHRLVERIWAQNRAESVAVESGGSG